MKQKETVLMRLLGKKVYLRPMTAEDVHTLKKWLNDPDVTKYLDMTTPFMRGIQQDIIGNNSLLLQHTFITVVKDTEEPIGFGRLQEISEVDKNAKFLQVIGEKKYWGCGFAFDARMLLLYYAFNTLKLIKVYGRVYRENARMLNQAKKAGARIEGVLEKHKFRDGKFHDLVLTATFKEGWEQIFENYQNS
ncbi:MAG: GNAT family N-acetyltransferase [Parcubacteria group bacterium]|nr:GNAT family N-acetyltransferase [Parcubacteria group bacterium]